MSVTRRIFVTHRFVELQVLVINDRARPRSILHDLVARRFGLKVNRDVSWLRLERWLHYPTRRRGRRGVPEVLFKDQLRQQSATVREPEAQIKDWN